MLVSRTYRNNLGFQIDVERPNPIYACQLHRFNRNHYTFDGYNTYMAYNRGGEKGMQYGGGDHSVLPSSQKGSGLTMANSLKIAKLLNTQTKNLKQSLEPTIKNQLKNPYGKFMNPVNTYRPGFAGEKHLMNKDGIVYNFCGPGTNIEERLKRGDPPVDSRGIDLACKVHDIEYHKARSFNDIKKADVQFVENIKKSNVDTRSKNLIKKIFKNKSNRQKDKLIIPAIQDNKVPPNIEEEQPTINITGQGNLFKNNIDPARKLRSKMKKYTTKRKKDKLLSIAINSIKNRIKR